MQYPKVDVGGEFAMPSGGELTNPNDAAVVRTLEKRIVSAYGYEIVRKQCAQAAQASDDDKGRVTLSNKMVHAEHMPVLAEECVARSLTSVNLCSNMLREEGAERLAELLPTMQLTSLWLDWNHIGDAGTKALATALPRTSLDFLRLESNYITAQGALYVARVLPDTSLTKLVLDGNEIGDLGVECLAHALPLCELDWLSLTDTKFTEEGALALAEAIPSSKLTTLTVRKNGFGKAVTALASLECVKEINGTPVNKAGRLAIWGLPDLIPAPPEEDPREIVEVVFEQNMGLAFTQDVDHRVRVERVMTGGDAEAKGVVRQMELLSFAGESTAGQYFEAVKEKLLQAARPLTLVFAKTVHIEEDPYSSEEEGEQ